MFFGKKSNGHFAKSRPVAVIDIGSNSVRLVVYEAATRSPAPLFNEKVLCGLGRTLATTGRLADDGVNRALRALRRFKGIARQLGADGLNIIATAAAREAENGPEFIVRAEEVCGAEISVLSGRKEAKLAASGVIAGSYHADGLAADLGGGSLEIIDIRKQNLVGGVTLPLGGLRLIDESGGSLKKASKLIDASLKKVDWLSQGEGRPFYAVGGTWRAFARLHMAQTDYPLSVAHGYTMSVNEALKFARLLDHLSPTSLEGVNEIPRARRETVPYGALVLERLLMKMRPSQFVASAFGVREGLLYTLLPEAERCCDPLLSACEELAEQRSRSPEHAVELLDWTDALFTLGKVGETAEQRRLRHAACLLSDIGWRAHTDYRGEQSLNFIAHAAFAGVDHPGRAFLALTVFYRHQGLIDKDLSPRLIELVDKETLRRAKILGAAIRVANVMCASMAGIIPRTPLIHDGEKLILDIPKALADLDGERLENRLATLARQLDLEPEIRTGGAMVKRREKESA